MPIKAITSDIEGTLVDLELPHHEAYLAGARHAGLTFDLASAISGIGGFIGGPDEKVARSAYELCGGKVDEQEILQVIVDDYDRRFQSAELIFPRPGAVEKITEARAMGLSFMLQTGTPQPYANLILEKSGLLKLFTRDQIVLPEDVEHSKPAPDAFLESARRAGVAPYEQLVLEDSVRGVLAAKAAGSWVVGMPVYSLPQATEPLLQNGAFKLFMSWGEMDFNALLNEISG